MNSLEKVEVKSKEGPKYRWEMVKDIKTQEIKNIAPDLFKLAQKIFESGKTYDLILSDDASGRLVSLFLRKVLNSIQEKQGLPVPDIRFVTASHRSFKDVDAIYSKVSNILKKLNPNRTLLVTEHVQTGRTMTALTRAFKILSNHGLNFNFDIAALSIADQKKLEDIQNLLKLPKNPENNDQVFWGELGQTGFHNLHPKSTKQNLAGVYSSYDPVDTIPHRLKQVFTEKEKKLDNVMNREYLKKEMEKAEGVQEKINQAREDINLLAEETLKEFGG